MCRQTIYCTKEHSSKIQTAFKKWRCGNFLQNDDGYFLVEQTVSRNFDAIDSYYSQIFF